MPSALTKDEIRDIIDKKFGDKFEVDLTGAHNRRSRVKVVCPEHGPFETSLGSFLSSRHGCRACSIMARSASRVTSREEVVNRLLALYGGRFEYDKVDYRGSGQPLTLVCPMHGDMEVTASYALSGKASCRKCAASGRAGPAYSTKQAREKVRRVYGDQFDLSQVVYKGSRGKVVLGCKKHGFFSIAWESVGAPGRVEQPCPACREEEQVSRILLLLRDLSRLPVNEGVTVPVGGVRRINGDRDTFEIQVHCSRHGKSTKRVSGAAGVKSDFICGRCGRGQSGRDKRLPLDAFIARSRETHGGFYTYEKVQYVNSGTPVTITCPKHGSFDQRPFDHLYGSGCPSCAVKKSRYEAILEDYLISLGLDVKSRIRMQVSYDGVATRRELDIFLPDLDLGIEVNGVYYHSDKFLDPSHLEVKQKAFREAGIRVVHLFTDEIELRWDAVRNLVSALTGKAQALYARDTEVVVVDGKEAMAFLDRTHIQGSGMPCRVYAGLRHNGELKAVMAFSAVKSHRGVRHDPARWELYRFSSEGRVVGGASKLFKWFLRQYCPKSVLSYSDTRLFSGELYPTLGFRKDGEIPRDYQYVRNNRRWHKGLYRRACLPKRLKEFDPSLSEAENCRRNGIYRVWDCGKVRWVWAAD